MVLTAAEARDFVALAHEVGIGSRAESTHAIPRSKVGVMIEVPEVTESGVIEGVIEAVDFLSIGTNDLTHYALGKSRHIAGDGAVSGTISLAETRKPEVFELISRVVKASKAAGKPVGICGESASDPESAKLFIELGVDSLSASSALLPQLKAALLA